MTPRRPAHLLVAAAAALGVLAGAACGGSSGGNGSAGGARVVRVVAAENFWGDVARQIGGEHAKVTSLISDPASDPHQFESTAHDAAEVADAGVVIVNGAGYDDFADKLLSATSHRGRVVVDVQQVLHATASGVNPHFWYDIPRVPEVAGAIERALAGADPADAATFAASLRAFDASLEPLQQVLSEIRAKYAGTPVVYTERVPEYLLRAAGLDIVTPPGFAQAIEDGVEPSPGDAQAMNALLSQHRARVLLYNAQATSPATQVTRDVAAKAGVPVVPVTETQPRDEPTYQSWQQHQLDALLRALGG